MTPANSSKRELKPLEVGDKVNCYTDRGICAEGKQTTPGSFGGVVVGERINFVDVKLSFFENYIHRFHRNQCRRLRKAKPKREEGERQVKYASRFAVDGADSEAVNLFASHAKACRILQLGFGSIIRLVECSESEVPVSRADLAKAFGQAFCAPKNAHKQMDSDLFEAIAAALFTTSERGKA